jgi:TrmH family RNA methyltransferase
VRIEPITSRSNPLLKMLRKAASRGATTSDGFALAESPHLLEEALRAGVEIRSIFATNGARPRLERMLPLHLNLPVRILDDNVFAECSTTAHHQGVLTLVKMPTSNPAVVLSGFAVVLDSLQDPGNAGTIVRSAEAFGASGVVFLKGSASPTNPKTLRAAAGSLFRLPFIQGVDRDDFLIMAAAAGTKIYAAASQGDVSIGAADFSGSVAVVIGSEAHGIAPSLLSAATSLEIPTQQVESLNAAVAASVILYEAARQRK